MATAPGARFCNNPSWSVLLHTLGQHVDDYEVSFEVLTTVKMSMLFWVVTPCGLAGRRPCCFHHQGDRPSPSSSLITVMTEAGSTPETAVNLYETTWRNISEDSHLQMDPDLVLKHYFSEIHFNITLSCTPTTPM
jgi:hypothetical protein